MKQDVNNSERKAASRRRVWTLARPSWEQRKRMLRTEGWALIVGSYVAIALAYGWPQDFRNESTPYVAAAWLTFMVRTFLFHLGLLIAAACVAAAWLRAWRLLGAAIPLAVITLGPVGWQFRPRSTAAVSGETVTVMSVNLLMVNTSTAPILAEIQAAAPDVLLLQEYTDSWHAALQKAVGDRYPHIVYVPRDDSFGSAIYSRRPFVEKPARYLPLGEGTEPQMRAVIEVGGRDVSFYNVHLLPPYGLRDAAKQRAQFADLLGVLAGDDRPAALGGDFNFTENSPFAEALSAAEFSDAFSVAGWGRGTTWPVLSVFRWIPSIRLDHIYVSRELSCTNCTTGEGRGSDHRPVVAKIGFCK